MKKAKRRKMGGRDFVRGYDPRRHVLTPEDRRKSHEAWAKKNLYWGDYDRYFASLEGDAK